MVVFEFVSFSGGQLGSENVQLESLGLIGSDRGSGGGCTGSGIRFRVRISCRVVSFLTASRVVCRATDIAKVATKYESIPTKIPTPAGASYRPSAALGPTFFSTMPPNSGPANGVKVKLKTTPHRIRTKASRKVLGGRTAHPIAAPRPPYRPYPLIRARSKMVTVRRNSNSSDKPSVAPGTHVFLDYATK